MPILTTCGCGNKFRGADGCAGQLGRCPRCGKEVAIAGPVVPPYDVFISYSSKDKTLADACSAVLEGKGLRCWIAPRDIVPGEEWSEAIIRGIEQSRLMVLVFSANANGSNQVTREVERAVAKAIPIIPVRIEDVPASGALEYFISCQHWLDAFTPPLEARLEQLADSAAALLAGAERQATETADQRPSRLRAAVRLLLARDVRPRVLLALSGLVVAALFAAFWMLSSLRVPVASEEVIQAKVAAERIAEQISALDKGQGFDARIGEADALRRGADTHFQEKNFPRALTGYQELLEKAGGLLELDGRRAGLRGELEQAAKARPEIQGEQPDDIRQTLAGLDARLQTGRRLFEEGRFKEASAELEPIVKGYASVSAEALARSSVRKARAGFEQELRHHETVLGDRDRDVRKQALALAEKAGQAESRKQFAEALESYAEARQLLKQKSMVDVKYVAYWAGFASAVIVCARVEPSQFEGLGPDYAVRTMLNRLFLAQRGRLFQVSERLRDRLKTEKNAAAIEKLVLGDLKAAIADACGAEAEACFLAGYGIEVLRMRLEFQYQGVPARETVLEECSRIVANARKGGFPKEAVLRFEKAYQRIQKSFDKGAEREICDAIDAVGSALQSEERDQSAYFAK